MADISGRAPPPSADIAIVGAGVVGCALAASLGREGFRVALIERDWAEPDRIVGELLQPGGMRRLKTLGLADCVEGIDAPHITGYGVFYNGSVVDLPYPLVGGDHVAGRSFHHGRFIMNLRRAALRSPGVIPIEGNVTELLTETVAEDDAEHYEVEEPDRVLGVRYNQGEVSRELRAPLTFVCDGIFSRFRKSLIHEMPKTTSNMVGLVLPIRNEDLPLPGHGHVIMADPSPILCYPIGSTECRLLVDVPGPLPKQTTGELQKLMREKVLPQMPEKLKPALLAVLSQKDQKLRTMPNYHLPPNAKLRPGCMAVGDAFNIRHPLTGGGMTVGFGDVVLIRELLRGKDVHNARQMKAMAQRFYEERKQHASTTNILANALYAVFSGKGNEHMPFLQEACFQYFKLGGFAVSGTMGLLGGLTPDPYILMSHFFAVAAIGMYNVLTPVPYPTKVAQALSILKSATQIFKPLVDSEGVTFLASIPSHLLGVDPSSFMPGAPGAPAPPPLRSKL